MKYDGQKSPFELLIPFFGIIREAVDILGFGAKKYAPNNWMKVERGFERYLAAALRHISDHCEGLTEDEETGMPNLSHAIVCLMMARWHEIRERHQPEQ